MKDMTTLIQKLSLAVIIMIIAGVICVVSYVQGYESGAKDTKIDMLLEQVDDANDRVDEILLREAYN